MAGGINPGSSRLNRTLRADCGLDATVDLALGTRARIDGGDNVPSSCRC